MTGVWFMTFMTTFSCNHDILIKNVKHKTKWAFRILKIFFFFVSQLSFSNQNHKMDELSCTFQVNIGRAVILELSPSHSSCCCLWCNKVAHNKTFALSILSIFSEMEICLLFPDDLVHLNAAVNVVCFCSTASFYNLPCVNDFIIDILLGSPSGEVSGVSLLCLYRSFRCVVNPHVLLPCVRTDPAGGMWSAVHLESERYIGICRAPKAQPFPAEGGVDSTAPTLVSHQCHEGHQPEVHIYIMHIYVITISAQAHQCHTGIPYAELIYQHWS